MKNLSELANKWMSADPKHGIKTENPLHREQLHNLAITAPAKSRRQMFDSMEKSTVPVKHLNGERFFLLFRGTGEDGENSGIVPYSKSQKVADRFSNKYGGETKSHWVPESAISISINDSCNLGVTAKGIDYSPEHEVIVDSSHQVINAEVK